MEIDNKPVLFQAPAPNAPNVEAIQKSEETNGEPQRLVTTVPCSTVYP